MLGIADELGDRGVSCPRQLLQLIPGETTLGVAEAVPEQEQLVDAVRSLPCQEVGEPRGQARPLELLDRRREIAITRRPCFDCSTVACGGELRGGQAVKLVAHGL